MERKEEWEELKWEGIAGSLESEALTCEVGT
jgi:hypothetical protein